MMLAADYGLSGGLSKSAIARNASIFVTVQMGRSEGRLSDGLMIIKETMLTARVQPLQHQR